MPALNISHYRPQDRHYFQVGTPEIVMQKCKIFKVQNNDVNQQMHFDYDVFYPLDTDADTKSSPLNSSHIFFYDYTWYLS